MASLFWDGKTKPVFRRPGTVQHPYLVCIAVFSEPAANLTGFCDPAFHLPYLSTDPDGILHVEDPVSRREFVCILHILLNTDRKGQGTFLDVSPDDSCHDAAALLKDLGVLDGPLLHPDADLARGEMLRMLCAFFPPADGKAVFQDMTEDDPLYPCYCTAVANGWISDGILVKAAPAASVCRGELARVLNRVLGRETAHHRDRSEVGTILDVPPTIILTKTTVPPSTAASRASTSTAAARSPPAMKTSTARFGTSSKRSSIPTL